MSVTVGRFRQGLRWHAVVGGDNHAACHAQTWSESEPRVHPGAIPLHHELFDLCPLTDTPSRERCRRQECQGRFAT